MANDPHTYTIQLTGPDGIAKGQLLALLERVAKEHNYRVLQTIISQGTIIVEAPQLGAK